MSARYRQPMVGIMGLLTVPEDLGWATISDYIGRPNVYTIFFVIGTVSYFLMPVLTSVILFQILVYAIVFLYGGGLHPFSYIGLFEQGRLGAIHGYILTAWAVAGIVGPMLLSLIYDNTNSYQLVLIIFGGMHVISLIISLWIRGVMRKMKEGKIYTNNTQAANS
ncbi:hypothetical protein [Lentibacillus sp. CBA3610]|uniref:hypothetical protein n=1 Tax=Lentibacillus sp. CBA3610 TaxID=2518176 RepID=UPI00350E4DD7